MRKSVSYGGMQSSVPRQSTERLCPCGRQYINKLVEYAGKRYYRHFTNTYIKTAKHAIFYHVENIETCKIAIRYKIDDVVLVLYERELRGN